MLEGTKKSYNLFALLTFLLLSGCLSIFFGKDLNWDLTNYHYYDPYALLHHRYNLDYWPASIQTFLNPLIDLPFYFMINHFPPLLTGFLMGAIHGLNFWLFLLITLNFVSAPTFQQKYFIAFVITLIGMYSPHVLIEIGKSFNDLIVSIFVFSAVLYCIKQIRTYGTKQPIPTKKIALTGLLLGLGVGLKYTTGIYLAGVFIAFLFVIPGWENKIRWASILSLFSLIGIAITAGYWMLFLFHKYHNPFYPFYEKIFHAGIPIEKVAFQDWRHQTVFPHSIRQAIFFPFYFSWSGAASDNPFMDFRYPIVYCLFIWLGLALVRKKIRFSLEEKWLFLFFIFSYITWEIAFSALRYLAALEIVCPLIIYISIRHLIRNPDLKLYAIGILFGFIMLTMNYQINWVIGSWSSPTFFGVSITNKILKINNALAIIPTVKIDQPREAPQSLAYLIPFFPESWRFVGTPYAYKIENHFTDDRKNLILKHSGPIYLVATTNIMPSFIEMANHIGLTQTGACTTIKSECEMSLGNPVMCCPMKKTNFADKH